MSRGTDALAEAKAVAGPETLAAEYQEAKREARERDEVGVEERGDGQQTVASRYFGGLVQ